MLLLHIDNISTNAKDDIASATSHIEGYNLVNYINTSVEYYNAYIYGT